MGNQLQFMLPFKRSNTLNFWRGQLLATIGLWSPGRSTERAFMADNGRCPR